MASAVEARIGETLAQCETRYGPVVERKASQMAESDKEACVFSKEGVTVTVEYRNGIAWWVSYRMPQPALDAILGAIAPEGGWAPSVMIGGQQMTVSAVARDQVAIVTYPAKSRRDDPLTLVVATRSCGKANREEYQKKLAVIPDLVKEREAAKPLKSF